MVLRLVLLFSPVPLVDYVVSTGRFRYFNRYRQNLLALVPLVDSVFTSYMHKSGHKHQPSSSVIQAYSIVGTGSAINLYCFNQLDTVSSQSVVKTYICRIVFF